MAEPSPHQLPSVGEQLPHVPFAIDTGTPPPLRRATDTTSMVAMVMQQNTANPPASSSPASLSHRSFQSPSRSRRQCGSSYSSSESSASSVEISHRFDATVSMSPDSSTGRQSPSSTSTSLHDTMAQRSDKDDGQGVAALTSRISVSASLLIANALWRSATLQRCLDRWRHHLDARCRHHLYRERFAMEYSNRNIVYLFFRAWQWRYTQRRHFALLKVKSEEWRRLHTMRRLLQTWRQGIMRRRYQETELERQSTAAGYKLLSTYWKQWRVSAVRHSLARRLLGQAMQRWRTDVWWRWSSWLWLRKRRRLQVEAFAAHQPAAWCHTSLTESILLCRFAWIQWLQQTRHRRGSRLLRYREAVHHIATRQHLFFLNRCWGKWLHATFATLQQRVQRQLLLRRYFQRWTVDGRHHFTAVQWQRAVHRPRLLSAVLQRWQHRWRGVLQCREMEKMARRFECSVLQLHVIQFIWRRWRWRQESRWRAAAVRRVAATMARPALLQHLFLRRVVDGVLALGSSAAGASEERWRAPEQLLRSRLSFSAAGDTRASESSFTDSKCNSSRGGGSGGTQVSCEALEVQQHEDSAAHSVALPQTDAKKEGAPLPPSDVGYPAVSSGQHHSIADLALSNEKQPSPQGPTSALPPPPQEVMVSTACSDIPTPIGFERLASAPVRSSAGNSNTWEAEATLISVPPPSYDEVLLWSSPPQTTPQVAADSVDRKRSSSTGDVLKRESPLKPAESHPSHPHSSQAMAQRCVSQPPSPPPSAPSTASFISTPFCVFHPQLSSATAGALPGSHSPSTLYLFGSTLLPSAAAGAAGLPSMPHAGSVANPVVTSTDGMPAAQVGQLPPVVLPIASALGLPSIDSMSAVPRMSCGFGIHRHADPVCLADEARRQQCYDDAEVASICRDESPSDARQEDAAPLVRCCSRRQQQHRSFVEPETREGPDAMSRWGVGGQDHAPLPFHPDMAAHLPASFSSKQARSIPQSYARSSASSSNSLYGERYTSRGGPPYHHHSSSLSPPLQMTVSSTGREAQHTSTGVTVSSTDRPVFLSTIPASPFLLPLTTNTAAASSSLHSADLQLSGRAILRDYQKRRRTAASEKAELTAIQSQIRLLEEEDSCCPGEQRDGRGERSGPRAATSSHLHHLRHRERQLLLRQLELQRLRAEVEQLSFTLEDCLNQNPSVIISEDGGAFHRSAKRHQARE